MLVKLETERISTLNGNNARGSSSAQGLVAMTTGKFNYEDQVSLQIDAKKLLEKVLEIFLDKVLENFLENVLKKSSLLQNFPEESLINDVRLRITSKNHREISRSLAKTWEKMLLRERCYNFRIMFGKGLHQKITIIRNLEGNPRQGSENRKGDCTKII
ncbi:unnamed protein product [Allacma fusca]|uniref:Uncharacterized protein n=1 Tax=Allacma fusca TaxID=39272 RepID=A0A8J2K8V6_9HEXA|nr:unnamed protein product [Allacma fusca]